MTVVSEQESWRVDPVWLILPTLRDFPIFPSRLKRCSDAAVMFLDKYTLKIWQII